MTEIQPPATTFRPITPPATKSPQHVSHLSGVSVPKLVGANMLQPNVMNVGPLSPVNQNGSFAWDRVIKSGKVSRRVKKKGAWKPSWKPAYLVLRPNLLSVYKDQDETELRASITLSDVTTVASVKKTNTDHVFGVFSPAKNYHFAGMSAKDAADWINAIRVEAHTEDQTPLELPSHSFNPNENHGYETTDLSADDVDAPGSPEMPHWSVKGNKSKTNTQGQSANATRQPSAQTYSTNDIYNTSQSDFSDALSSSIPNSKSYLSGSVPKQPSILPPIADDPSVGQSPAIRPSFQRNASQVSDLGTSGVAPTSNPATTSAEIQTRPRTKSQPNTNDPVRIIKQSHLQLQKSTPSPLNPVKQWKTVWAVLRSSSLSLHKSREDPSPSHVLPLSTIIDAAEIDPRGKSKNRQRNCFQVICADGKTYRFACDDDDGLEAWLGAMMSVLVKHRGPGIETGGLRREASDLVEGGLLQMTTGVGNLVVTPAAEQPSRQPQLQPAPQIQTQAPGQAQPDPADANKVPSGATQG